MNYELLTVRTDEFEMECIRFGHGATALVILPGISLHRMADSAASVANAYSVFCEQFTVYLFDRRKDVLPCYTIEEMADDTAMAMQKLSLENACLFGASQGGAIGIFLCAKYPELVQKAVLGSTFAKPNETSLAVLVRWAEIAGTGDFKALQTDFFRTAFSDAFYKKNKAAFELLSNIGNAGECARFRILANACLDFDGEKFLSQIRCPVLVLGAENDRVAGVKASKEIAEKTGAQLYIYPSFGHAVYDEADDYKERILNFLL